MPEAAAPPLPVVGRFAPSPTGPLHLGSLVAAVGSYLFARRAGGRWLLRIEDLDGPRVVPGMADDFLRTLEALGLRWDGSVVYQSRRLEAYDEALERLREAGQAYPCACTRAEVARLASAPHLGEEGGRYPGTCRAGLPPGRRARAVRVRVGDVRVSFCDTVQGPFAERMAETCGDFVVKRADGPAAYQLAVVVDDAASGVTEVVRGADLLGSTPRQIHLQRLLTLPTPQYAHLPLVTGPGGAKLSKRDHVVSLAAGRNLEREGAGLLVAAVRFLGQRPPAELTRGSCEEVLDWGVRSFEPRAVPREPGPFPPKPPLPCGAEADPGACGGLTPHRGAG